MKYHPNIIPADTEDSMTVLIGFELQKVRHIAGSDRNRILRYGWDYEHPKIWRGALPPWTLFPDLERLLGFRPDNLTINEYLEGDGIRPHIDSEAFGDVGILSLGDEAEMRFTKDGEMPESWLLEPRSLFVMSGERRHKWKHETLPLEGDCRYSLVYRKRI